jgi:hypothetical protein
MDTAIAVGDAELALRLVNAMAWHWFLRGSIGEARRSIRQALAVPGQAEERRNIARCWDRGLAIAAGEAVDDEAFGAAQRIKGLAERATASWFLGYVTTSVGMPQAGRLTARALSEFEALVGELGERWGQLQTSYITGSLAEVAGDYDRAERMHRDGLSMAEELGLAPEMLGAEQGFKPAEMYAATDLGLGARRTGEFDVAEKHLRNVLD